MNNMQNIFENLGLLNNTNALSAIQIKELGSILPEQESINVLEFGAGRTTIKLFEALKTKYKCVTYVTYETDEEWAPQNKEIEVRMFKKDELIKNLIKIPESEKFDLIIVDGPDGELRKYWYKIFKHNIKTGSIIHIDDAFHYDSFEKEFRKYLPTAKDIFVVKNIENTNKCWITCEIL
jgi:predicted O-methyltransferase YrrM